MKKKILITDRFAQDSFLYLQQHSQFEVVRADNPQHLPLEHLVSAHALIIRSRTKINEELLKKAQQLQLIIT
ncbi:MAG TPA: phosphoglycerate dehydrogenase, partial [Bdellovibrio sp.]